MSLDPFSLFSFAKSASNGQILQTTLHNDLDNLVIKISQLTERQPRPEIWLKSNNNNLSSNVADGVLILPGLIVPDGYRGVVEDFNISFTTVAGTIRLVVLDPSGNIRMDILRGITNNTNGTGRTVLEENESIAVVGQSAGAGVFSVFCTGLVYKVR